MLPDTVSPTGFSSWSTGLAFVVLLTVLCVGNPGVALARGGELSISGTRWVLNPDDGWTSSEIQAIGTLVERLPREYRDPGVTVAIELRDAPELDLSDSHLLGRLGRLTQHITLYTRGLAERLGETDVAGKLGAGPEELKGTACILLQRVLVHELTHLVDRRQRLSGRRDWRDLSGWRWWSHVVTPYSPFAYGDFAAPWGARSPAEDLATFSEVYFIPPSLGPFDAEESPRCRFPGKYRYFKEKFEQHPETAPDVVCSGPADAGLPPERVGEIHILMAAPTLRQAASIGGHLLLAVEILEDGGSRWDTFALVADSGNAPEGAFQTIMLGLVGGFPSRVDRYPYETVRQRYVEGENRDLLHYRWLLSTEEKTRLLERLDEMGLHWRRPYLFLQQNCSAMIVELARAVEPGVFPTSFLEAPDMVLAELARRGRIVPVPPDPGRHLSPATRAQLLAKARARASADACGAPYRYSGSDNRTRRDRMYLAMIDGAETGTEPDCWARVAEVLAYAAPLDEAVAIRPDTPPAPGWDAALASVRTHVPMQQRLDCYASANRIAEEVWSGAVPVGAASLHAPYSPVTLGLVVVFPDEKEPEPMVMIRRTAIDLQLGRPRVVPTARGLDLHLLDVMTAFSTSLTKPSLRLRARLVEFTWQPEPLVSRPMPLLRLEALSTEWSTLERSVWVRWLRGGFGATLLRSARGWCFLDVAAGVDLGNRFLASSSREGVGNSSYGFRFGTPVTLHGAIHTDGRTQVELEGSLVALPSVGTVGDMALALVGECAIRLYLGELEGNGASLSFNVRDPFDIEGTSPLAPLSVELGLRIEPR